MRIRIESARNERVKLAVRLRDRRARDEEGLTLIEGYRENLRALEAGVRPAAFFFCRDLFLGSNEDDLLRRAAAAGADLLDCAEPVFRRISYRDRPDGLLSIAPIVRRTLADLILPAAPLLLVVESVEKPGNLGTMLRSADAAGADAVVMCDPRTDLYNPNTVRASLGTLFTVPVTVASSPEALSWLRARKVRILAGTPSAERLHFECDMTGPVAIAVGAEQYGLSALWMGAADERVRIPMLGRCDSLNVASAATLLLYEAVRQRWPSRQDSTTSGPPSSA